MASYRFDDYSKYPIHEVLGDPGAGKSLYLVYLAWTAHQAGVPVFANFHLKDIPFHYVRVYKEYYADDKGKQHTREVNDLLTGSAEDGTAIEDGILLYDEPQSSGMGKHQFFQKQTQDMAAFVSQIRKRDLALVMATQRENFPVFDVRQLISKFFLVYKTKTKGVINVQHFDVQTETIIKRERLDLRVFFRMYDSKELIGVKYS
jgi:hypothetical protein